MIPGLQEMLVSIIGEDATNVFNILDELTGFDISNEEAAPFLEFHDFITNPQPYFITRWRSDERLQFRYHRFVNGVLGNTRQSYTCVKYHQSRIEAIEAEILRRLSVLDFEKIAPSGGFIAMGRGETLHFEYQAYVLAYRRCLDQFAWALTTYFNNECSSFRKLGEFLDRQKKSPLSAPLKDAYLKHIGNFGFVISNRKKTAGDIDHHSVRDRLAHEEAVPAGTFNISSRGLILVGGGEDLNIGTSEVSTLTQVLDIKTANLHQCLSDMLLSLVSNAREVERAQIQAIEASTD